MNTSTPIIALKALTGNAPAHLLPMQVFLSEHLTLIKMMWQILWVIVFIAVIIHLLREYKHRTDGRP